MAAASFFRSLFLNYFVKPVCERSLFRSVSSVKPQRIVEIGLGDGERALDLIELAQRNRPTFEIRYIGLDLFDARTNEAPLKLKDAHQSLKASGASIQLIPGPPIESLSRVANNLAGTDMLIISASADENREPDWYFIPRMMNDHSLVFWQTGVDQPYTKLALKDVRELAEKQSRESSERKAA